MRITSFILFLFFYSQAFAQEDCLELDEDELRLSCYDRAFGRQGSDDSQSASSEEVSAVTATTEISPAFLAALSKMSAVDLIEAVESAESLDSLPDEMRVKAIDIIFSYVRPLPASNAEANRNGYAALAQLDPSNSAYKQSAERYAAAIEENRTSILRRMKKRTDEFNGNVFYEHPNTPRYVDTRSYIAVYIGQNEGRVWLRMRLNYTSDSWLFVENAAFNIDGETIRLPYTDWKRDNDSEIWEWIDVPIDADLRATLEKISVSKSTIVRFNGQQYYDNVTIRETDKQVIRDMFLVEEILKSEAR